MSLECGECEHDLRGGHAEDCSRHPVNRAGVARVDAAMAEYQKLKQYDEMPSPREIVAYLILAADKAREGA